MNHLAYINYFQEKAVSHYMIRHDRNDPDTPSGKRASFFRMNLDQEIVQASNIQIDYPYLKLPIYRGRLTDDGGMVSDVMTGFFEIRQRLSDLLDFDQLELAREECKRIGFDIIALMAQEYEDLGACGPITDFDVNTVQYDFTGPVNDCEIGCLFFFEFRDTDNLYTRDLSTIFL